jgi:hypothetical protein
MMTYDETDVADDTVWMVDRTALLAELLAALHHRIVRHYRLIRVLSDNARDERMIERMASRVGETEDIASLVLAWMKDPEAIRHPENMPAEDDCDGD